MIIICLCFVCPPPPPLLDSESAAPGSGLLGVCVWEHFVPPAMCQLCATSVYTRPEPCEHRPPSCVCGSLVNGTNKLSTRRGIFRVLSLCARRRAMPWSRADVVCLHTETMLEEMGLCRQQIEGTAHQSAIRGRHLNEVPGARAVSALTLLCNTLVKVSIECKYFLRALRAQSGSSKNKSSGEAPLCVGAGGKEQNENVVSSRALCCPGNPVIPQCSGITRIHIFSTLLSPFMAAVLDLMSCKLFKPW